MSEAEDERRSEAMRALVEGLCAPECAGRAPGSRGSELARVFVTRALERAGVEPAGTDRWLQRVPGAQGYNVLGRIGGQGRKADRAILIGAHYDHLGRWKGELYPGADDNAAAVAILADAAAQLVDRARELDRQVIIAAFDSEEPPHFLAESMGSMWFCRNPIVPLDQIDTMICMDLVGHALGPEALPHEVRSSVFVLGAELGAGTGELVDEVAARTDAVHLRRMASDVIPSMSDYAAFEAAKVPYLFLTAGRWQHYHRPTDTPDKLDYRKMRATADALVELALASSTRPVERVQFRDHARDDGPTLRSLQEIAQAIRPVAPPEAELFLAEVSALQAEVRARGGLGEQGLRRVSTLVAMLEAALAG